jgi:putative transposase
MAVKRELVDELLKDVDPKKVFGSEWLLDDITKALAERVLAAELDEHLAGIGRGRFRSRAGNRRNGYSKKTVLTDSRKLELEISRDRRGSFEPQLITNQRRFPGFDEKFVSMYARGMSVHEIQGHLRDLYGIEVSLPSSSAPSPMSLGTASWPIGSRPHFSLRAPLPPV